MTLRKKTLLYFTIVLVCVLFVTYIISNLILLRSFENMELQVCKKNIDVVFDAIHDEVLQLKAITNDWSGWDDTYSFIKNGDSAYKESNLADETLINLDLNYMIFCNKAGNLVFEKGIDLKVKKEISVSDDFGAVLKLVSDLFRKKDYKGLSGIILLKSGPAIMSALPVLKSDGSGPSNGFLIFVRKMDSHQISKLSKVLHLDMTLKSKDDSTLLKEYAGLKSELSNADHFMVAPEKSKMISGYRNIYDAFGNPSFVLKVNIPRDIYNKGRESMWHFMLSSLIICLVFITLTLNINEKVIIRRLLNLSTGVLAIGKSNDYTKRVTVQGHDELSSLSATINGMLASLEQHVSQLTDRTEQLEETKSFLESVFNTVSEGICVLDVDGKVIKCNTALLSMLHISAINSRHKRSSFEFFPAAFHEMLKHYMIELKSEGRTHFETYMLRSDKTTFPAEFDLVVLNDKSGSFNMAVAVIKDITHRKKAEHDLKRKTEEQALLLDNTDIQIWYLKDPETYGSVNNAHAMMLGMDKIFIENQKISNIYNDKNIVDTFINANTETFMNKKGKLFEVELFKKSGELRVLHVSTTPKLDKKGNVEYIICTAEDITKRKESEAKIIYLSYHDKLTGLYNRAFFEDELKRLDTEENLPLTIIIGDINGLKIANDVFGHNEGDKLLIRIANTLKESCREGDIIARWGGDEFAVILPKTSCDTALEICKTISDKCVLYSNDLIKTNIALGISTKLDALKDIQQMIKEAEDRMYRHKLLENRSSRSSYVSLLEKALFERNYETEEHAQRMRKLSVEMGKVVGLSSSELDELNLLAALHDIGKIAIPDNILLKPGPLTEEEYETMKKHPEIGYRIAVLSQELTPIAEAILTHHERWDGKGYPQGLKGEEINIISRIVSIVDTFDVMTHKRPYKDAVSADQAINEIKKCAGTQFDPHLVDVFINLVQNKRENS